MADEANEFLRDAGGATRPVLALLAHHTGCGSGTPISAVNPGEFANQLAATRGRSNCFCAARHDFYPSVDTRVNAQPTQKLQC
ncbi:MAG: hypothetical protein JWR73_2962 [Tardiphaga sp.]|nr:hypothetical protein [Tardiphaga sp.]